jgi:hypothetical protein
VNSPFLRSDRDKAGSVPCVRSAHRCERRGCHRVVTYRIGPGESHEKGRSPRGEDPAPVGAKDRCRWEGGMERRDRSGCNVAGLEDGPEVDSSPGV